MSETRGSRRRVIFAGGATRTDAGALAEILAATARLDAELAALFVEDINLVRLSDLPFARETGRVSGASRSLPESGLPRVLREQAARWEQALAAAAGQFRVEISFQVTRGLLSVEALARAAEADLVVLAGRASREEGRGLAAMHEVRPVAALVPSAGDKQAFLNAARQFAQDQDAELLLLAPAFCIEQVRGRPGGADGASVRVRTVETGGSPDAIARTVNRHGARILLLDAADAGGMPRQALEALLALVRCPLGLVR